jgi:hypothetical protein
MKTYYTAPSNLEFYQAYSGLVSTLRVTGYLAQAISALTEFGVIFSLIKSSLVEIFPDYATQWALLGAILGTLFLEAGLRKFLPFSFRVILYHRYQGLHLPISISVVAVTVALVLTSALLSYQGSREMAVSIVPLPQAVTDAPVLQRQEKANAEAMLQWQGDSLAIEQEYQAAMAETGTRYALRIAQEKRTPGYSPNQSRRLEAQEKARLATNRAVALKKAIEQRNTRISTSREKVEHKLAALEEKNALETHKAGKKAARYGGGLAWFTVIALGILIFGIGIEEAHRKGSGMEETSWIGKFDFEPGLAPTLSFRLEEAWQRWWRNKVPLEIVDLPVKEQEEEKPLAVDYADVVQVDVTPTASDTKDKITARICVSCATPFTPRTSWQRFCNTSCRLEYHGKKHGKPYLPRKLYQARRREAGKAVVGLFG